ncbi:NAD-dependent epimerase/dehydratase family protein [Photobacterium lutimaris]|uniref:Protein yeeZ n=1 Tax=Photobacterium lutimaris TaxID=388278 RepID=A0A2T3J236_9GAMM|nr:NAD-dependent epimerase/dehydratase family protein [Photobacterium lutimaris]PSU35151.1 protein yeeZ precursor [Photobacterium lutimaris]TDR77514.1 nucleoside-diphosphate-sugar epimerase [Photobacterium lutimaris]
MQQGLINKISICGCGWFGLPLAKHFVQLGIETWGSKQDTEKAQALAESGIHGVALTLPLSLEDPAALAPQIKQFFNTDLLVINVPPGRGKDAAEELIAKIKRLSDTAKALGCRKVVFISTTAVYGTCKGVIKETTEPRPNTLSGKAHLAIEKYLLAEWGSKALVVRFSGLIGPNRHPVRFLSGRQGIENGMDRVNLIHLDDCITAISQLLNHWPQQQVLHLASAQHPTREEYYCKMAQLAGLPLPVFTDSIDQNTKVIDAAQTCQWLSMNNDHDNLLSEPPEL